MTIVTIENKNRNLYAICRTPPFPVTLSDFVNKMVNDKKRKEKEQKQT